MQFSCVPTLIFGGKYHLNREPPAQPFSSCVHWSRFIVDSDPQKNEPRITHLGYRAGRSAVQQRRLGIAVYTGKAKKREDGSNKSPSTARGYSERVNAN